MGSMSTFTARDIAQACICLNVRKAARQVARRYDEAFRPLGITSGQFSILAALLRDDPASLGRMADVLGMDRTTLNRNLKPLEDAHLVATVASPEDRRVRGLVLTAKGKDLLEAALPLWEDAQEDSGRRLAATPWPVVRSHLEALS